MWVLYRQPWLSASNQSIHKKVFATVPSLELISLINFSNYSFSLQIQIIFKKMFQCSLGLQGCVAGSFDLGWKTKVEVGYKVAYQLYQL